MAACFMIGVALLPVRRDVRWLIVIVAALDWPLLYAVKLGQVEPLLFLGFAAAWRWMDRAAVVGGVTAIGTLVKVQPALLGSGRSPRDGSVRPRWPPPPLSPWAAAATIVTGLGAWATYADLLRDLGGQLTTPHNFAPGAVAHMAGASEALATAIQLAVGGAGSAALLVAWRYASPGAQPAGHDRGQPAHLIAAARPLRRAAPATDGLARRARPNVGGRLPTRRLDRAIRGRRLAAGGQRLGPRSSPAWRFCCGRPRSNGAGARATAAAA